MELREYLTQAKMSITDFSILLNCERAYLSHIVNGKVPGRKLAQLIERKTKGKVKIHELRKEKPQDEKLKYPLPLGEP